MNLYLPQPAYKIYAFDRGWRIMRYVTTNLFQRTDVQARWWFGKARDLINYSKYKAAYIKYCLYVVVAGLGLAGAAQYITAMIIAALFIAIHAIVLSVWVVLSSLLMAVLAAFTFTYSKFYGIFFRCPDCHFDMPIPLFMCPQCNTEHSRLWPSIYGVFTHRCKTCNTNLPALGPLGRNKLPRICPRCRRPLNAGIGSGTNLHIPIVGGPSTGKTNYIVMATQELKQTYETMHRYSITFTDSIHEQNFHASVQSLSNGQELLKTPDMIPQAYNLSIKGPRAMVPTIAYIYDAAGEVYGRSAHIDNQVYYKYIDGIIFVIDPCAIPTYRRMHQGDISLIQQELRPSLLDVMEAYERMKEMFEASINVRKGQRYPHPIAVVLTKVDALGLEQEIGLPAAHMLMQSDPSIRSEEDAMSTVVRTFLGNYGLDNFVRDLELQFSNVKYFSSSALGRLPLQNDTRAFTPIRVLDPLIWLLSKTKTLKAPRAISRATTRLPEAPQQLPETIGQSMPQMMQQNTHSSSTRGEY